MLVLAGLSGMGCTRDGVGKLDWSSNAFWEDGVRGMHVAGMVGWAWICWCGCVVEKQQTTVNQCIWYGWFFVGVHYIAFPHHI